MSRVQKGYVQIWNPSHPNATKDGYVNEHRLVMESHLGHYLRKNEVVHHIDKNKENNKLENLILFESNAKHLAYDNKKDMSSRICLLCYSPNTRNDKRGNPMWLKYQNGYLCHSCYYKKYNQR